MKPTPSPSDLVEKKIAGHASTSRRRGARGELMEIDRRGSLTDGCQYCTQTKPRSCQFTRALLFGHPVVFSSSAPPHDTKASWLAGLSVPWAREVRATSFGNQAHIQNT